MGEMLIRKENVGGKTAQLPVGGTFESEILKRVIKESWRDRLPETSKQKDDEVVFMLDQHASKMHKVLGSFDYEVLCMPNIMANSRNMTRKELAHYLAFLEALAVGYLYKFDNEFVNLLLAGLTLKAKTLSGLMKHFESFLTLLEGRLNIYRSRAEKESRSLESICSELESMESSLLRRIFKKGDIRMLRLRTRRKAMRIKVFHSKAENYANMLSGLKKMSASR